ncbi:hypothetical protein N7478_009168 [Penicillium angulare]|uniref:uncharacterized protein n=1 Tax=Penicillium angulare TaxID=116970 RepID=UPI00254205C6|nr:uncharacterized protein N7478_009168 [Penicillium angulare]KAJ5274043.1 hypothetical protein N7478_009168 [Penicillium angulare]
MQASGGTGVASLLQGTSLAQASEVVTEFFAQKLSKALGITIADNDANKPLHQYGVDSLVAVELRGWLTKELQAELGVFNLGRGHLIFGDTGGHEEKQAGQGILGEAQAGRAGRR